MPKSNFYRHFNKKGGVSLRILPYTLLYTCTCAYICVRKIQQVISHIALSRLVMISPQGQIALSLG